MSLSGYQHENEVGIVLQPIQWLEHSTYQRQRHISALDGLRAVAVSLVITCHLHERMWDFLSGSVGVTIFFVLSGYLITRLALLEEMTTGRLCVTAFYVRRSFRILPLYYIVLAFYIVLIYGLRLWPAKLSALGVALPYYLMYFQELPVWITSPGFHELPFYQSWSLGVEEKFYLAWPLFIICISSNRNRLRFMVVGVTAILCVVQGVLSEKQSAYHLEYYAFILFGVGLALFLSDIAWFNTFAQFRWAAVPLAFVIALITQFGLMPHTHLLGLSTLYASAITVLVGSIVSSHSVVNRLLSNRALVVVGRVSYGIYLVHILCVGVVEHYAKPGSGVIVGICAYIGTLISSTAIACMLFRIVEVPLIRYGKRLSSRVMTSLPAKVI